MKKKVLPLLVLVAALLSTALYYLTDAGNPAAPSPPPFTGEEELAVHFIDVGQADCALLQCGGANMLIDGGNVADSSLVVSYLEGLEVEQLDYVICTHAHEDHVGGLSGPLNTCRVLQVLAPVTEYDSKAFEDFANYTAAQGLSISVPEADTSFSLGEATVTVLGPRREYQETNDTSLVLRVDFGETSFLFTGDAEREAEADLLEAGCPLDATVLKVGHHGSETSTSYPFLREVMPQYAVISVGADNSYGHPDEAVLSRLRDAGATVYRTDLQGTVIAISDGTQVVFSTETSVAPEPGRDVEELTTRIGNLHSSVFHRTDCPNLPAQENQVLFSSAQEALAAGYTPCGNCDP